MISNLVLGESLDVLIDHRGKTPGKLGSDFVDAGVPVASAVLVNNGRLDLSAARFVDDETWRRWMAVPTRAGDVLLTSEAPLGRVGRVETDAPLVLGQRLYGLRGKAGVLDSGFLYYALQTDRVQADLLGRSTGTTVFGIRQSALRHVVIPAPPHTEQQAIAEVLGALDDKIAVNATVGRLADRLAESFLLRQVSNGTVKLAEIAEVTMGSSPPGSSYNEHGRGVPFYQGVRDFGTRFPSRRVWTDQPVRMASAKETLLSVRAPVGRTNLASEEMCIGRGLAALRSRTAHPMTLFHQVRAAHSAWAPYEAEGTVFGAISRPQLEGIDVPAVDRLVAADLEDRLAELESVVATCLRESAILAATRDELLPHLMSGKVRVKDAEKAVEGVL